MNKARDATDDDAPMAPNVPNDVLPAGGGLSKGFLVNGRINESRAAAYYASPATADTKMHQRQKLHEMRQW